jgi:gluconokinase
VQIRTEGLAGGTPYRPAAPLGLVIMGVSGSGKTTLAKYLAQNLDCPFLEGDDYHAASSVAKMRAGSPLDDDDRWPWLDRLGCAIGKAAEGGIAISACSALKRSYRQRLSAASQVPLYFILLSTRREELAHRVAARAGHYMPATLLDSQLAILEPPEPDERALVLASETSPSALAEHVLAWLRDGGAAG